MDPNNDPNASPTSEPQDLSKILKSVENLGTQLGDISERLDAFEEQLNNFTPATSEPAGEPPKWQPKSWDEFPQKAEEIATQVVESKLQEEKEIIERTKTEEETLKKQVDEELDTVIARLEKNGTLPAITNKDDENDPGNIARRELFGLGYMLDAMDLEKVNEIRKVLNDAGYSWNKEANKILRVNTPPAGATVPVASSSHTTPSSGKPSYDEIHKSTMDSLISRFFGRG